MTQHLTLQICWVGSQSQAHTTKPACSVLSAHRHQTKLYSPTTPPEKEFFGISPCPDLSPGCSGFRTFCGGNQHSASLRLSSHLPCLDLLVKASLLFVIKPARIKEGSVSITCKTQKQGVLQFSEPLLYHSSYQDGDAVLNPTGLRCNG